MRLLLLAFLVSCPVHTWAASIENIRIWPAPDNTRLVFDTSAAVHAFLRFNSKTLLKKRVQ